MEEGRETNDGIDMGSGGIDRNGLDLDQGDDEDGIEKNLGAQSFVPEDIGDLMKIPSSKNLLPNMVLEIGERVADWFNQLDPRINKRAFSEEEEERLLAAHRMYGNKWAMITRQHK
ncbi:unnamed protein product [Camellia sinensis]